MPSWQSARLAAQSAAAPSTRLAKVVLARER
jgi:hypothetical protein